MTADDPASLLRFAHGLLDETDAIAMGHVAGGLTVSAKPDRTLVTQADTEIETHLRDRIADAYPAHTVARRGVRHRPRTPATGRWIIDPIDATHNVVRGIEVFATLLAFERDGELLVGVVSAPAMHRRWWATRGGGAARPRRRRRASHPRLAGRRAGQRPDRVLDPARAGGRRARRRAASADRRGVARPGLRRLLGPHAGGPGLGGGDARVRRRAVGHGRAASDRDRGRRPDDRPRRAARRGRARRSSRPNGLLHDQVLELLEAP